LPLLWRGDGDRQNTNSADLVGRLRGSTAARGCPLIM
jgi:hypothetical protein